MNWMVLGLLVTIVLGLGYWLLFGGDD